MGSHNMSVLRNPRVAGDETYLNNVYRSTFKNDYRNCGQSKKADFIDPPKPAKIQHCENGLDMSKSASVARTGFKDPTGVNSQVTIDRGLAYHTNFQIGDDGPTGKTVMSGFYQPREVAPVCDTKAVKNKWMSSAVPEGDREKLNNPDTTSTFYTEQYKGYACGPKERAISKHYTVASANDHIHASNNSGQRFQTSTQNIYSAHPTDKPIPSSRPYASIDRGYSSVPTGDLKHPRLRKDLVDLRDVYPKYNQKELSETLRNRQNQVDDRYTTSIKLGEGNGCNTGNNFSTEQAGRYNAFSYEDMYPLERTKIERNHSDVPQGDGVKHMSKSLNNFFFKPNFRPNSLRKVERNQSFVNFGDEKECYESTTDASYTAMSPQAHPEIKLKTSSNQKGVDNIVPLKYKAQYSTGQNRMATITMSDFNDKKRYQKLQLNQTKLESLRCSHLFMKNHEEHTAIDSTQDELYRPPAKTAYGAVSQEHDAGWLQRSNVPLGTLGTHISGCHKGWY